MTTLGGPFQLQNLPTVSSGGSGGGKKKSNRPKKPKGDGSGKKKSYVVKTHRENLDMSSEEEEEEEEYKKGGYHPVEIGNVFNSRIKVTAKLGWGHFSTVWLATDSVTSRTVALKVVKSAQHYTEAARDEIKILQKLTQEDPSNESCVIHLLDHFEVCGINGNHVAMVFEKLGCNLLTMIRMYKYKGLPVPLVRMMAKQILVGVEFLHRCDVIHTDLKPENLLLVKTPTIIRSIKEKDAKSGNTEKPERAERAERAEVPVRDNSDANDQMDGTWENPEISEIPEIPEIPEKMEETELQKSGSTPSSDSMEPMSLANSLPTLCVPTEKVVSTASSRDGLPWSNEELLETFGDCYQIKIVDLGNACWTFKHFTDDVQTRQYRAPEVILGAKYDTAIDVWSVACIVFELLSGDLLFEPKADKNYDKNDDHLAQIQELLGRMPKQVALNGKHSRDFFNRHGELRYLKDLKYWSLKDVLHEKYKFSETEAKEISLFLSPMLNMSARDRATAKQMLDHPWLKGVDVNLLKTAFWE